MPETFWEEYKRDFWHTPLIQPFVNLAWRFMFLERGSHFPFYVTKEADSWGGQLGKLL